MNIKIRKRIKYIFDFDEDDLIYDLQEVIDNINEEISEVIYTEEFIQEIKSDYKGLIDIVDCGIEDNYIVAELQIEDTIQQSDIVNTFENMFSDILNECDTNISVHVEGEVTTPRWNPTTNYGYDEGIEHVDGEGYIEIELDKDSKCEIVK